MLALLLACATTVVFLHARPARGFARRVFHWRIGDMPFVPANERAALLPNVTFWAWERPEDLRFLPRDQAGVAFLAKTISLETPTGNSSADSASLQENQSAPHSFPIFSDAQRALLASEISDLQSIPGVSAIQIDFDAPA